MRDDESSELYTEILELKILELKKLPQNLSNTNQIIQWMKFFSEKNRKEFENMFNIDEYLDEAVKELFNLSTDDQKRLEYEANERALRDYNSQMLSATRRGLKEGFTQGREEGLAKGMEEGLAKGMEKGMELTKHIFQLHIAGKSVSEIAAIYNITEDEVNKILF